MRRDAVRGLTTAAGIWLVAAIGAACGADLPILATATTVAYFLVVFAFTPLVHRLPASPHAPSALRITYEDGRGRLRQRPLLLDDAVNHDAPALRAEGRVSVQLHPVFSLGLGA